MFDNDKHRVLAKNIASQRSIDGTNLSLTMESGHPFNTNACYGHEDGFGRALISGICDIVAMGYNPRRDGILELPPPILQGKQNDQPLTTDV